MDLIHLLVTANLETLPTTKLSNNLLNKKPLLVVICGLSLSYYIYKYRTGNLLNKHAMLNFPLKVLFFHCYEILFPQSVKILLLAIQAITQRH